MDRRPVPRWLIVLVSAAVLLVLAGGGWLYRTQERRLRQEVEVELRAIAALKASEIARWRAERLGDAAVLMDSPLFVEGAARWLEAPQPEAQEAILTRLRALQAHYGYDDILLVDVAGQIRLSLGGETGPVHAEAREALQQALAERRPVLTDLHRDSGGGAPHLGAVAPLYAESGAGAPSGAIFLQVNAETFLYPLVQAWPTDSRTAETLLVRREGDDVLFLNDLRHQPGAALTLRVPLTQTDVPAVMAALGREGLVEGRDYRGVRVVSVLQRVPASPWYMVAKQDAAEVYAQWRLYAGVLIGLLLALLAGVLVVGYAFWQGREAAHYRAQVQAEAALYASEARHRTTLLSVGDAVISTDAAGRVALLNPEAERLTGWPQEEALGHPLEEVFRIVNEESRRPVESPVARALREGQVVGLANHTLLLARDGAEWPIADSGAPVHDDAGRVSGVVLVFRDQTEERAVQRALAESEARYRGLFAHALSGVALHEIVLDEDGQPVDYRYLEANAAFERHTALSASEVTGRRATEVYATPQAPYLETYARAALHGEPASFETYFEALGRHFSINAFQTAPGQFATVFRDITAEKEAERLLRDSEAQLRQMIDGAPDPIFVQTEGRFAYANAAMVALVGAQRVEEIIGRPVVEQFHPDDREIVAERIRLISQEQQDVPRIEQILLRLDGSPVDVEVAAAPLYYRGHHGALAFLRDVTARKEMERALARERALLRTVIDNLPDAVYAKDIEGRKVLTNPEDMEILGAASEADVLGKTDLEIFPAERGQRAYQRDLAVIRDGETLLNSEHLLVKPNGERQWFLSSKVPWRDAEGRIIGLVGVTRDVTALTEAQEALRQSEARFRRIVETANEGIWEMDASGVTTFVNAQMAAMLGYAPEKMIGQPPQFFLDPEDLAAFDLSVEARRRGEKGVYERRYRTKDGHARWMWVSSAPIQDAEGGFLGCFGMYTDITARKEMEEALRESEARYRHVFEDVNIGLYRTSPDGRILMANPALVRMLGYASFEELAQRNLEETGYEPQYPRARFKRRIEAEGQVEGLESAWVRADGATLYVRESAQPIRDEQGNILYYEGTVEDITARAEAEAALARERALLRTVMDTVPDAIFVKDAEARKVMANRADLAFIGVNEEADVLGKTDLDLFPAEVAEGYYADDLAVLQSGEAILNREERLVNAKGERRWLLTSKIPLHDAEGRITGLVGVGRDITMRKQAEEERERLEQQLRQAQKMEAVGRLAGGVAHDFNNMLQTILGYAELALEETPAEAPLHEYLREIRGAGQRSASLTRQLLAFARRQTIRPEPLDLNDAVAGMLRMLGRLIGEDIELIWKPGPNLGQVLMDPSQLDQILANLVVNARDAIGGVGQVTIETENVTVDESHVARHAYMIPGRYVLLAVSDSGCGMDVETLSHLFEPFFTTKPIGEGTGLGLPTVYGIVKQNEGFINVYSEVGQGTTFCIYLPRHDAEPTPAEAVAPRAQVVGGQETVLLVEDEQPLLQLGRRILQQLGYTVLAARSPAQALALAQEHEGAIHLLVTDVVMPEMNGRELAERLGRLRPEMKCLYMSGYTANVIAHRGVVDEGVLFLQKPFTVASMAAQVRAALDGG